MPSAVPSVARNEDEACVEQLERRELRGTRGDRSRKLCVKRTMTPAVPIEAHLTVSRSLFPSRFGFVLAAGGATFSFTLRLRPDFRRDCAQHVLNSLSAGSHEERGTTGDEGCPTAISEFRGTRNERSREMLSAQPLVPFLFALRSFISGDCASS